MPKISQLPEAEDVTGEELVLIVQGGATKTAPLEEVRGPQGDPGASAYQLAVANGYEGSLEDYLALETDLAAVHEEMDALAEHTADLAALGPHAAAVVTCADNIEAIQDAPEIALDAEAIAASWNRFRTKALLLAGAATVDVGQWAIVAADEDHGGHVTLYEKEVGGLVHIADLTEGAPQSFAILTGNPADNAALDAALDGKAANDHDHAIADVTGLQAALDAKLDDSQKGAAGGLAELDGGGKVPTAQLPALAITDTFVVNSQAAQLALVAEEGDVCVRTDQNKSYIHNGGTAGTMADWQELLTPTDTVLSVAGKTGAVTLVKADVGLGNVDNTSDANKPVSTATQTALDGKAPLDPTVSATASIASPWAWNSDTHNAFEATAQAANLIINADAGAPVNWRRRFLSFAASAAPRTITFTGGVAKGFVDATGGWLTASGANFTYTIPSGKTADFSLRYSSNLQRWRIVGVAPG